MPFFREDTKCEDKRQAKFRRSRDFSMIDLNPLPSPVRIVPYRNWRDSPEANRRIFVLAKKVLDFGFLFITLVLQQWRGSYVEFQKI